MQSRDEFEVFTKSGTSGSLTLIMKKKPNQDVVSSSKDRILVGMSEDGLKCKQTRPADASYTKAVTKRSRKDLRFNTKVRVVRKTVFPLGRYDDSCRSHTRPEISYEALIQMAFADMYEKHNVKFLRVCEIADWLREKFPYFCTIKYLPQCITYRLVSSSLFQRFHIEGRAVWSRCVRGKAAKHLKRSREVNVYVNRADSTKPANLDQRASPRLPRIRKKPDFFCVKWDSRKRKAVPDCKHRYLKPRPKESDFPATSEEKQEWKAHLEYLDNVHSVVKPLTPDAVHSGAKKAPFSKKSTQKLLKYLVGCDLNVTEDATPDATDVSCPEFTKHCMFAYLGLVSAKIAAGDGTKDTKMAVYLQRHECRSRRPLTYDDNEDQTLINTPKGKDNSTSERYGPPQLDATVSLGLDTSDEDVTKERRFVETAQKGFQTALSRSSAMEISRSISGAHNSCFSGAVFSPKVKIESSKHSSADIQRPLVKEVSNWTSLTKKPITIKQEVVDTNIAFSSMVKRKKKRFPAKIDVKSHHTAASSGRINEGAHPNVPVASHVSPHLPKVQSVFSLKTACPLSKTKPTSRQRLVENRAFLVPNNARSDLRPSYGFCHEGVFYQPENIAFPLDLREFVPPYWIPNSLIQYNDKASASLESYSEPTWTRDVKKSVMTTVVPAYCYVYPLPVVESVCPPANNLPCFEHCGHRVYRSPFCGECFMSQKEKKKKSNVFHWM